MYLVQLSKSGKYASGKKVALNPLNLSNFLSNKVIICVPYSPLLPCPLAAICLYTQRYKYSVWYVVIVKLW
jgi:hypothetical protein